MGDREEDISLRRDAPPPSASAAPADVHPIFEPILAAIGGHQERRYPTRDELVAALEKTLNAIDGLMAESHGVAGLHLNGDVAPWDELVSGGKYEAWLGDLEDARAVLTKAAGSNPSSREPS